MKPRDLLRFALRMLATPDGKQAKVALLPEFSEGNMVIRSYKNEKFYKRY